MSRQSFCLSQAVTDRERIRAMRRRREASHVPRRSDSPAPSWWEPLVVLAFCALLGWASWYLAFGGWR